MRSASSDLQWWNGDWSSPRPHRMFSETPSRPSCGCSSTIRHGNLHECMESQCNALNDRRCQCIWIAFHGMPAGWLALAETPSTVAVMRFRWLLVVHDGARGGGERTVPAWRGRARARRLLESLRHRQHPEAGPTGGPARTRRWGPWVTAVVAVHGGGRDDLLLSVVEPLV